MVFQWKHYFPQSVLSAGVRPPRHGTGRAAPQPGLHPVTLRACRSPSRQEAELPCGEHEIGFILRARTHSGSANPSLRRPS